MSRDRLLGLNETDVSVLHNVLRTFAFQDETYVSELQNRKLVFDPSENPPYAPFVVQRGLQSLGFTEEHAVKALSAVFGSDVIANAKVHTIQAPSKGTKGTKQHTKFRDKQNAALDTCIAFLISILDTEDIPEAVGGRLVAGHTVTRAKLPLGQTSLADLRAVQLIDDSGTVPSLDDKEREIPKVQVGRVVNTGAYEWEANRAVSVAGLWPASRDTFLSAFYDPVHGSNDDVDETMLTVDQEFEALDLTFPGATLTQGPSGTVISVEVPLDVPVASIGSVKINFILPESAPTQLLTADPTPHPRWTDMSGALVRYPLAPPLVHLELHAMDGFGCLDNPLACRAVLTRLCPFLDEMCGPYGTPITDSVVDLQGWVTSHIEDATKGKGDVRGPFLPAPIKVEKKVERTKHTFRRRTKRKGGAQQFPRPEPVERLQAELANRRKSPAFKKMLRGREKLPAYKARANFLETVDSAQVTVVCADTGAGKCWGIGTPLRLMDGSTRAVEDIGVGDVLIDPESRPTVVQSVTSGRAPMFNVVVDGATPWSCNGDHLLALRIIDPPQVTPMGATRARVGWWGVDPVEGDPQSAHPVRREATMTIAETEARLAGWAPVDFICRVESYMAFDAAQRQVARIPMADPITFTPAPTPSRPASPTPPPPR